MADVPFAPIDPSQLPPELLMQLLQRRQLEMPQGTPLPDAGLGPVTPTTVAGNPNPMAMPFAPSAADDASLSVRRGLTDMGMPGLGERLGPQAGIAQQVLDAPNDVIGAGVSAYGDQLRRTGDAARKVWDEPSLRNAANLGVQTGASMFNLPIMGGSAAIGFGDAALEQFGNPFAASDAQAASRKGRRAPEPAQGLPGLTDEQNAAYTALRAQADREGWGPKRRAQEFGVYQDMAAKAAERQGASKQGEYDRQVVDAEQARAKEEGRDRRFSETPIGQFYDDMGGLAPFAAAGAAGAAGRIAHGPMKGFMGKFALPWAEGAGAAFGMQNLPDIYNQSTEAANPAMRAAEEYGARLPEGHPDKQRSIQEGERLRRVQPGNPVKEGAEKNLRDPDVLKSRGIAAAIEGLTGPIASGLTGAPTRFARQATGAGDEGMIQHLWQGRQAAKAAKSHHGTAPGKQTPEQRSAAQAAASQASAASRSDISARAADPATQQWFQQNSGLGPNAVVKAFNEAHGTTLKASQVKRLREAATAHSNRAATDSDLRAFVSELRGQGITMTPGDIVAKADMLRQRYPSLAGLSNRQLQRRIGILQKEGQQP